VYKISFNLPNLPKGGEIDITGLHVENPDGSTNYFQNGKTYEISDAMAENFRLQQPVVVDGEEVPGAPLDKAFKDNPNIKVEIVKKSEGGDK
jgi:hypothetical protein